MEYVAGRNNLACTIFVPYDCDNNCSSGMKMDIDRIIEMIDYANQSPTISEFVITGGEPTANLPLLKRIVDACQKKINKLQSVKYKDYQKFSKVQMNGSDTFAYVEDDNGHFVYDNNAHKFIDITK